MLNALQLNFAAKYGIDNLVEHMRIFNFGLKVDLLSLGTFSLDVILPKVSLFFASTTRGA